MKLYRKDGDTFVEVEGALTLETHKSKIGAKVARIEALEAELAGSQKAMHEALGLAESAQAKVDEVSARRTEDVALVRAGIDDDLGMAAARLAWNSLPEDGRGSLVDTVNGWRTDPSNAPRPLQPYLASPEPAAPQAPVEEPAPSTGAGLPKANAGAKPAPPPDSAGWTLERIQQARREGTYEANRDAINHYIAQNPYVR